MAVAVSVLIIEDSEPDAELLTLELEHAGYDPKYEIVDTPEAMAAALDKQSWDVILCDYVMPHFSGLDALRIVQERGLDTPFIMVSGKIGEDVAIDTMLVGAQDYVLKSNLGRLAPAVRREIRDAVGRRRANEARRQAEEALQRAYDEQEQRIAERTVELLQANLLLSKEIEVRKFAEEAMRESEERFRLMADNSPVILWVTDAEGGNRFVNRTFSEFFGVTFEQVEGGSWQPLVHPDDAPQYIGAFLRSVREHTPFSGEARLRRADGEWRWLAASGHPRFSDSGEFLGHVGISIDITDRKLAEEALRESEVRYHTLFEAIDEGFCIIEVIFDENEKPIDYRFLEINPAFERQTGLIDAQGKRMRELAPKHEEHWFEIYGRIALTGEPARFQNRAEQLHRWYDVYAFRFGRPEDRQVAILFNDITARKGIDDELARAQADAERQAGELQSFMSSMADGLVVIDADGECLYINEAGRKMLEIPEEELCANWINNYERYTLDGELLRQEETAFHWALLGETVKDRRYKMVAPWGKEVTVSASGSPIRDAEGRIVGATLVLRDQKERIELERERQTMYERERHIAEVLQHALIPPMESLRVETCSIAVKYEPALKEAEVGGDFYDFFDLGDGKVGIVIGDVAGKGLVAAVYVAAARHAIRSYAYLFPSPAKILTLANEALCRGQLEDNGDSSMLTVFLAVVDTRTGVVTYANAGHDPPVVLDATGGINELDGLHDLPLAVACDYEYSEAKRRLEPEDTVVVVTDGITEARPKSIELFGKDGIVSFLMRNRETPLDKIPTGLLEAARSHAEGDLKDDAAIVVFACETGQG